MWNALVPQQLGIAIYSFDGRVKHGLLLNIGDLIQIREECLGWYRGYNIKNKLNEGIFPTSHVVLKESRPAYDGSDVLVLVEDVTVNEVSYVLREWNSIRKIMFIDVDNKRNAKFAIVGEIMLELINYRKQLVSQALTREQIKQLKSKITRQIDWGNRLLGLDLVPRVDEEPVDGSRMNAVELYQLHHKSTSITKDITSRNLKTAFSKTRTLRAQSCSGPVVQQLSQLSAVTFGLLMSLPRTVSGVEQEVLAYLRLYDADTFKPFTESFVVNINKQGNITRPDKQINLSVLFKDLNKDDLDRDIYLVIHAYRLGSLKDADHAKLPTLAYKKPFGCGAVRITDAVSEKATSCDSMSYNCKILLCSEQDFGQFHEHLMKKDLVASQTNKSGGRSFSLYVSIQMVHGEIEEIMGKEAHLIKGVAFSGKMGFPDIIRPDTLRNDLYVTILSCDIDKSNKSSPKSIEARIVVVNHHGDEVQGYICAGAGSLISLDYKSSVLYHNNCPRWNETFTLSLPVESFFGCHLRIELRHCSHKQKTEKKFLGFAFLKLSTVDSTTLHDGSHHLYVYKCDDSRLATHGASYLCLPDKIHQTKVCHSHFHAAEKEVVVIETLLCSTKLTQNVDIVRLLRWKSTQENLEDVLEKFMKVDGKEVVKFLPDILDAMFDIFSNTQLDQQSLSFKSLVHIFNILKDSKFENFKSVFEIYMTNNFFRPLVYSSLLSCMCQVVESLLSMASTPLASMPPLPPSTSPSSPATPSARFSTATQFSSRLFPPSPYNGPSLDSFTFPLSCFKVIDHLSRCIVQSWLLFLRTHENCGESFYKHLTNLLQLLTDMLGSSCEDFTTIQSTFLLNLPSMLLKLSELLAPGELASILIQVVESVPLVPSAHHQVSKSKLKCLNILTSSLLFDLHEWTKKVMPLYTMQLKHHLVHKQNVKLSVKILSVLLMFHSSKENDRTSCQDDVQMLLENLLCPVMTIVGDSDSSDKGGLMACFVSMLSFFDENSYKKFVQHFNRDTSLKEVLNQIFLTIFNLINSEIIPRDWFVARMNANCTFLHTLQLTSTTLFERFHSSNFDAQLWESYFAVCVAFIVQPALKMEVFSDAKSQKIKATYGDMRIPAAHQISSMWGNLGNNMFHFIPSMIGPFLEVSLLGEEELRKTILPIFFDMMECHQGIAGNFQVVEDELINKLDNFLNESKGDREYRHMFETIMMKRLKTVSGWQDVGMNFVQSVGELLERLLDYRSMLKSEDNIEIKMTCTVNLLNFYKDEINRREMYIRYIYKLHDLHLSCGNHIEAAFCLLLHAELLDWSNELLPASQSFPAELQWSRKEGLYLNILREFDQGKCWEYGIPLCEELAVIYKERIEYSKLSHILEMQSKFYNKILSMQRLQPTYFRVAFYGANFPPFLRGKEYIYRGNECENLSSFQSQVTAIFPEATHLSGMVNPDDGISNSQVAYIQINSVKPVAEISSKFLSSQVSESIRSFYKFNNVSVFVLDRPYHSGPINSDNEFMTLHIERLTLRMNETLPGILRWFPVASVDRVHLCPIEVAIDTMEKMNQELQTLVIEYLSNPSNNLSPLTMRLQGVIDAAVQGGVKKYQQAFFCEEFSIKNPQHINHVNRLQILLESQVQILRHALDVHEKLATQDVLPLHKRLQDLFSDMQKDIVRRPVSSQTTSFSNGSSSSSSLSSSSAVASNRNSATYNEPESTTGETSLFKQKSHTQWYTKPDGHSFDKKDMTFKASQFLNLKSNRKNSSTPTLTRSDSYKRKTILEEYGACDRPVSEAGVSTIRGNISSPSPSQTPRSTRSVTRQSELRRSNLSAQLEAVSSLSSPTSSSLSPATIPSSSSPSITLSSSSPSSSSLSKCPIAGPLPPPILPPKRSPSNIACIKPPVALPKHPPPPPLVHPRLPQKTSVTDKKQTSSNISSSDSVEE